MAYNQSDPARSLSGRITLNRGALIREMPIAATGAVRPAAWQEGHEATFALPRKAEGRRGRLGLGRFGKPGQGGGLSIVESRGQRLATIDNP